MEEKGEELSCNKGLYQEFVCVFLLLRFLSDSLVGGRQVTKDGKVQGTQ